MAWKITGPSNLPGVLSELGQFTTSLTETFIRVGTGAGYRMYFGSQYGTMGVYGYAETAPYQIARRMSLPPPRAYSGDSATPFTVTPSATYDPGSGPVAGDITQSETPTRWYVVSWGDETTAQIYNVGGNPAVNQFDARYPFNQTPFGNFGNYSSVTVEATIGASDTVVTISALAWTANTDYRVTHAYFWAADSEFGPFRYVGRMVKDPSTGFAGCVIYDTLAGSELITRSVNVNDWLPVPTFTSVTNYRRNRIVGVGNGDKTRFPTRVYGVYVKVTHGSKTINLVDATGTNLTTKHWPVFLENSGANLEVEGTKERYPVDYIDKNTPYIAYLVTEWSGPTTTPGTGDSFEIWGANTLYICAGTELQNSEQCRPRFIFDGFRYFQGEITSVFSDAYTEGVMVFTVDKTFMIRGLPDIEDTQATLAFAGTIDEIGPHGCISPNGRCRGLWNGSPAIFVLNDTFLGIYSSTGIVDISSIELRTWIRQLAEIDKRLATMIYDGTRNEIVMTFMGRHDLDRDPNDPATLYSTEFEGLDLRELALRYNLENRELLINNGNRCRCVAIAPGVGLAGGGEGSGNMLMWQDLTSDVLLEDEKRLVDKQGYTDSAIGGVIAVIADNYIEFTIDGGVMLDPYIRATPVVVQNGTARGSFAYIVARHPNGVAFIIDDWVGDAPLVGDVALAGTPILEYQTGSLIPSMEDDFGVTRFKGHMRINSAETYQTIATTIFSGGSEEDIPDEYSPTATQTWTKAQIRSGQWLGATRTNRSQRIVVGFTWIQPFQDDTANAAIYRTRMNQFQVLTTEDQQAIEEAEGDNA